MTVPVRAERFMDILLWFLARGGKFV